MKERKAMAEFEVSIPIEGSKYNERIIINKYGDQYSLVLGREGQSNGTVYMQWCHPSDKDKKPREKAVPWKIPLGDYSQARTMLSNLLSVFAAPAAEHSAPKKPSGKDMRPGSSEIDGGDIPF